MKPASETTVATAEQMLALMRNHSPPRDVYRGENGGYWLTYPGDECPRQQVSLDAVYEALRRGLIRAKYQRHEYWELAND